MARILTWGFLRHSSGEELCWRHWFQTCYCSAQARRAAGARCTFRCPLQSSQRRSVRVVSRKKVPLFPVWFDEGVRDCFVVFNPAIIRGQRRSVDRADNILSSSRMYKHRERRYRVRLVAEKSTWWSCIEISRRAYVFSFLRYFVYISFIFFPCLSSARGSRLRKWVPWYCGLLRRFSASRRR